jgi:1,4-dihydroxy-2-naphthoate octaprenyltransferase
MRNLRSVIPSRSSILHLRFGFSLFLMPVYLFAFSQVITINVWNALWAFFIWHFLAFPASNGYNSYFDQDKASIGLLEKPPAVDISLYYLSLLLEILAFLLGFLINWRFAAAVLLYGVMSKLYSHPSVRLKKYPIGSFLTVLFFQGAFIYWTTYMAISNRNYLDLWHINFIIAGAVCSALIGASYPLTQIYQHEEDGFRGDRTISLLLGFKYTFVLSGGFFLIALLLSFVYWTMNNTVGYFYLFLICTAPVFLFFNYWFYKVLRSGINANYKNAMRMNFISAGCTLFYFLVLVMLSRHIWVP